MDDQRQLSVPRLVPHYRVAANPQQPLIDFVVRASRPHGSRSLRKCGRDGRTTKGDRHLSTCGRDGCPIQLRAARYAVTSNDQACHGEAQRAKPDGARASYRITE